MSTRELAKDRNAQHVFFISGKGERMLAETENSAIPSAAMGMLEDLRMTDVISPPDPEPIRPDRRELQCQGIQQGQFKR